MLHCSSENLVVKQNRTEHFTACYKEYFLTKLCVQMNYLRIVDINGKPPARDSKDRSIIKELQEYKNMVSSLNRLVTMATPITRRLSQCGLRQTVTVSSVCWLVNVVTTHI